MEDNKIIELYFERSEKAISETSLKYGKYCYCIAFNILYSEQDSEECVNDTYLRAWNSIPPRRPSHLQAFLAKICRNLALNLYEKKSAAKRGYGEFSLVLDELSECIPTPCSKFDDDFALNDILNEFLKGLSATSRKIFIQRYWYTCSIKDIAKNLGITENRVTVSLFRTRERLRVALRKEGITI